MAKSVELANGRSWPSKKAAKQHFKDMLARYMDGDIISDFNDHSDLAALLERFDVLVAEGPPKIGAGIERFERRLNRGDGWSSSGFWVVRSDGTSTDFSYPNAIDGAPKSTAQEFYDACHNAVSKDLLSMKQNQFDRFGDADGKLECDVTGDLISYSEAHLAHADPTFGTIVNAFRERMGWDKNLPVGLLTVAGDAQLSTTFAEDKNSAAFKAFHHGIAIMRIVSKTRPAGSATMATSIRRPLRFL
jgi:hypothetical protein